MRVAVMSHNRTLHEGLSLQIAAMGGVAVAPEEGGIQAVLIDAGTGAVPQLTVHPQPGTPALVLLTPAARGSLAEMRQIGFGGYLVKPVRQSSLAERLLLLLRQDQPAPAGQPDGAASLPPHGDQDLPPLVTALRRPEPDPPTVEPETAPPHPPGAHLNTRTLSPDAGLNVLLAEDNPVNMMLIRELLRRRGHTVHEASNGQAAVRAMRDRRFDLLLTDIHMPGMDGIEAARAIRALERENNLPRTPIVALTADALDAGKHACREAGMDGFLTKPVDPAELEEMFLMLFPGEGASHIVAA
jgi:CheY-like chemotaxis protein